MQQDSKIQSVTGAAEAGAGTAPSAVAEGTIPTNRVPSNCKILRQGVDSLYLSYRGQIDDHRYQELDRKRELAQSRHDFDAAQASISILDHLFAVSPKGRRYYRYELKDNAYGIQLAGAGAKSIPVALVQIASQWITSVGLTQSVDQLTAILAAIAQLEGEPFVSRADLFVDFTYPPGIDEWPKDAWVTRGRRFSAHHVGDVFSGWTIALGGDISARLYNKTLEIQSSGKDYLKPIWAAHGWEPGQAVYRLEFQIRREVLKALGVSLFPDLICKMGSLWRYATEDWLRLSVPNPEDQTASRWETHPMWIDLAGAHWEDVGKAERVVARKDRAPSEKRLLQLYMSALSTYMAITGVRDPLVAAEKLDQRARDYLDTQIKYFGVGFDEKLRDRAARKAKDFNLPFASPAVDAAADEYRKASGR
jgi:hypothetical protein